MSATIYDIAERADVSTATVSRVFNDEAQVREETRERVLEAADALHYQPHASARNLARQCTDQIAVVAPVVANHFYMRILRGVRRALADREMDLIIHAPANAQELLHERASPDSRRDLNTRLARALRPGRHDGILLLSVPLTDEWTDQLKSTNQSVVLADAEHPAFESFAVDNEQGGYEATRHLLDLGYERIGHVTVAYNPPPARLRRAGYEKALREAGRSVDERLIATSDERPFAFSEKGGYRAMRALLGRTPVPDAVFAASDMQAMGALRAVREVGLEVPDDVAIVGFDDVELSRCAGLTTLRQPAVAMGARAAESLLRQIEDSGETPMSSTVFAPELVVRRTCGARGGTRPDETAFPLQNGL